MLRELLDKANGAEAKERLELARAQREADAARIHNARVQAVSEAALRHSGEKGYVSGAARHEVERDTDEFLAVPDPEEYRIPRPTL